MCLILKTLMTAKIKCQQRIWVWEIRKQRNPLPSLSFSLLPPTIPSTSSSTALLAFPEFFYPQTAWSTIGLCGHRRIPYSSIGLARRRVVSGRAISLRLQTGIPCLSQQVLTISCIDGLCNKHIASAKQIIFHIWNWRIVPWGFYLFTKQLRLSTSLGYVLLVRKTETICAGQISLVWGSEWGWGELIHPRFPALQPPVFYISHL